ncbi:MAG: ATP synthase F1 subunit delta [Lachnospiraceae bacterium]|nr:ATP synthase F1 subunit delta [Clostridiales bacterium]MCC8141250.1 ATP synthase F1 subunit delta [Lachnospiraceae bacterium]
MTQTASRYVRVLWELGISQDSAGDTLSIFEESPELKDVLCNPEIYLDKKDEIVDRIFPEDMRNFMKVLCRNSCVPSVEEIMSEYQIYANTHNRIVNATLTYVTPPNDEQMEGIKKFLLKTYDAQDVDLKECQDPSLVGGFILTVGDQEYDWSLRERMNALGKKLTGGED